jgi:hypothetical protein
MRSRDGIAQDRGGLLGRAASIGHVAISKVITSRLFLGRR